MVYGGIRYIPYNFCDCECTEEGRMKLYLWITLFLIALILPVSAGTAVQSWYNDTEGGGCVTAVDTDSAGTLIIAGYWNGNITAYNIVVNTSDNTATGTVAWTNRTNNSAAVTTRNAIKKIVADDNGNIAWISEKNQTGYISSAGAVGSKVTLNQNLSDVALRADAGAYAVTMLRSGTTPSQVIIYDTAGTIIARNTSFGANANWTQVGYDPSNQWIVTANSSSPRLYYWNITAWSGWTDFNPTKTASKNVSQQFLDSFPYRATLNLSPNTGDRGIFFQNTSAVTTLTKVNASYYQYNSAYVGQYFYWVIDNNLTNTQSAVLNMSIINGSGVNTNYSLIFSPGYYNYTAYYGNSSYSYSYLEQDNHYTITSGGDTILIWNTTGNYSWVVPSGLTSVQYLVVGGGAGAQSAGAGGTGGGGAGNVSSGASYSLKPGDVINIRVGGGGASGGAVVGGNSSFGNTTVNVTAKYGGLGGGAAGVGGTSGQPYAGGNGYFDGLDGYYCGGGGGGSTAVGANAAGWGGGCSGGGGGAGTASTITGASVTYGVGGAGGATISPTYGAAGTANTGNGGSGGINGGAGGSGIVVLRYTGASPPLYFGTPPSASDLGGGQNRQTGTALNQSSTKDYVGNIMGISVPSNGGLASLSTDTIFYQQYLDSSGIGNTYCATLPSGGYALYAGTVHDVKASNSGTASIEGRGSYGLVYDAGAVARAQSLTGNTIMSVDSAMSSGLFAAFGGTEGKIFMMSKEASPSWYSYYTGGIASPIRGVAVAWNGESVVVGRDDGRFEYYITNVSISPTPTPSYVDVQLRVYKDSAPYPSQTVTVYSSAGSSPFVWVPIGVSYTDGNGRMNYLSTTAGTYYKFVVNNVPGTTSGEGEVIWQSNTATTTVQIFIMGTTAPYEWSASYITATNNVSVTYSDTIVPTSVTITIKDMKTNTNVLTHTYLATSGFNLQYHDQLGNGSYQVVMEANRQGMTVRDTRFVSGGGTYNVTLPMEEYLKYGLSTLVLMVIAGLFGYTNRKVGAFVVVIIAAVFMIFSWLPVNMVSVLMIAAMFAVASLFGSRVQ